MTRHAAGPEHQHATDVAAIAQVCHEANRAWQLATGDPAVSPHWEDAPPSQRDSAQLGVLEALRGASPVDLHAAWSLHKLQAGWRYGPVKDEEARTHPCLVPYDELPAEQRAKDDLFRAIVGVLSGV